MYELVEDIFLAARELSVNGSRLRVIFALQDSYSQKSVMSPDMTAQLRTKLSELQQINVDMEHMWRAQIAQRKDKDIWKR